MTLRRYRRGGWGQVIARSVNRALADLEGDSSLPQVAGPVQMVAGVPVPFAPPSPRDRFLWLKVTGPVTPSAEPFYDSWVEQTDNGDGSFSDAPDGLTGSASLLAFEVGDREAPVGAVVPAWLSGDDPQSVTFEYSPPPEPLTAREVDGSPSVSPVTTLRFDQAAGLRVSSPFAGAADVTLQQASVSLVGYVSTGAQAFAGLKDFTDGLTAAGAALYVDTSLSEVWLSGYDNASGEVGAAWWVDGTLSGSHQNIFFHVGPYGATPANYWRLSDEGFQLAGGAFMIGGDTGQTITENGVIYVGGVRMGGALNVTAAVSSALAALGGVTLNI